MLVHLKSVLKFKQL